MLQNYQENTSLRNHTTCKLACELTQLVQLVCELKHVYMLKKELQVPVDLY